MKKVVEEPGGCREDDQEQKQPGVPLEDFVATRKPGLADAAPRRQRDLGVDSELQAENGAVQRKIPAPSFADLHRRNQSLRNRLAIDFPSMVRMNAASAAAPQTRAFLRGIAPLYCVRANHSVMRVIPSLKLTLGFHPSVMRANSMPATIAGSSALSAGF